MELEENRYVKFMYNVLYQRSLINVTRSWVTEVRNLLCNCGFAEVWYNQGVGYNEDFLKVVTQRIYDIYSKIGVPSYTDLLQLVLIYCIKML